jgi:riboflavin kinase/FMN adenylyltransferase
MMLPPKPARLATPDAMPADWRGAVVAIGNFDGVHRGHQALLHTALSEAERLGAPCLMLTLEPHPRVFFSGKPMFRLTPAPLKAVVAAALGLDGTLVFAFDRALADMSAEDFVTKELVGRLGIRAAVTGYDFHFGKARRGTPQFLADAGRAAGFGVTIVEALTDAAGAVSASRIRDLLAVGDIVRSNALLGWSFAATGTVAHGDKRGRTLGYPTANIALDPACGLKHGIYAVRFATADGRARDGVASYGRRPMFGGGAPLLETFVFDFAGDLYGQEAFVSFHGFIREERTFENVAALVAQMDDDSLQAQALLERAPSTALDAAIIAAWADWQRNGAPPPPAQT